MFKLHTERCLNVSGVDLIVVPTPKFPLECAQMATNLGTVGKYELGMSFFNGRSRCSEGNSFGATFKRPGTSWVVNGHSLGSPRVLRAVAGGGVELDPNWDDLRAKQGVSTMKNLVLNERN